MKPALQELLITLPKRTPSMASECNSILAGCKRLDDTLAARSQPSEAWQQYRRLMAFYSQHGKFANADVVLMGSSRPTRTSGQSPTLGMGVSALAMVASNRQRPEAGSSGRSSPATEAIAGLQAAAIAPDAPYEQEAIGSSTSQPELSGSQVGIPPTEDNKHEGQRNVNSTGHQSIRETPMRPPGGGPSPVPPVRTGLVSRLKGMASPRPATASPTASPRLVGGIMKSQSTAGK